MISNGDDGTIVLTVQLTIRPNAGWKITETDETSAKVEGDQGYTWYEPIMLCEDIREVLANSELFDPDYGPVHVESVTEVP